MAKRTFVLAFVLLGISLTASFALGAMSEINSLERW